MDGVDCSHAVVACRGEVGADAAVPAEGGLGVPVSGHGLMSLWIFDRLFAAVVGPRDGEHGGEQPDLLGVTVQPAGQGVAGVVAVWPVPATVVDPPGLYGLVVAGAQPSEQLRV